MALDRTTTSPPHDPLRAPEPEVARTAARAPGRSSLVRRRLIGAVVVILLVVPGISYAQALTYPGSASWQMRSVEWVRDHGGGSLVDRIENWYFTRHAPTGAAPAAASLPVVRGVAGTPPRSSLGAPAPVPALAGYPPVAGEGVWVPGRLDPAGAASLYTTFLRPDFGHPSVVAGAAWIRAKDTRAHLVAGTREPGGSGWPGSARVTPADHSALVATFNSGWKMSESQGGFYLDGRTATPLRDGQASFVIDDSGAVRIGKWGRDVTMTSHVVAVRQNLALIVDNGQPVPGLVANDAGLWGSAQNQSQYTQRSGVGVDAHGNLIYVGGLNLTLQALAAAMTQAKVIRGMELEIHSDLVSFASWVPSSPGHVTPTKLLPDMTRAANRYLAADQRDFFYVTLR